MGKSLSDKIKSGFKWAGITLGAAVAAVAISGCKLPNNPFNFPPKTIFNAYGKKSEIVISDSGTDLNGKGDIVNYHAWIKDSSGKVIKDISQGKPIDTSVKVPNGTYYAYGDVTDKAGADDQKGPVKVVILVNSPPSSSLEALVDPNNAEDILIKGSGTDPDNNLSYLEYWILNSQGNKIKDVKVDSSSVNASVPVQNGTYYVYLKAVDTEKASSTSGPDKVVVDKTSPQPPSPPTPVPSLGFTTTSGSSPLSTSISFGGSGNGTSITKYVVGVDLNHDGIIEANEEILSTTAPVLSKKLTFVDKTGVGTTYDVYEVVYGSNGTTAQSGLETITANPAAVNNDISVSTTFNGPYTVGDKLDFTIKANNTTNPYEPLTVDNSNRQAIGYRILHELGSGDTGVYEELLNLFLQDNLVLTLNKNGYLRMSQLINPEVLAFEMNDVDVDYGGLKLHITSPYSPLPQSHKAEKLTKPGTYKLEADVEYTNNNSSKTIKYLSQDFTVN